MTRDIPRWRWALGVAVLAIGSSIGGLFNQYVQDDLPIISLNQAMHSLRGIPRFFVESYWPPPYIPTLYRPFASTTFALQWALGSGSPLVFRLVSYLLYAACAVAVFQLARRSLPLAGAALVGGLFAVHPVHVEAVAVAVNQGEIWVGLLCAMAVALFLDARSRPGPLPPRTILVIAALYLTGCLFKENALVLPGLLLAAEALLAPRGVPIRRRLEELRLFLLVLALVAVVLTGVRTLVFSGDLVAAYPAEGLVGLHLGGRALTMLAVVPEWFRLLLWPAHLQADYSPSELVAQTSWGAAQTLGLLLLLATVLIGITARRKIPLLSFGIAWTAIALFPVHNVLVPTGIVLAERTLFLPSVGVVLALGGVAVWLLERGGARQRVAVVIAAGGLLVAGTYRSNTRHPVWSDQFHLWYTTANEDAPKSFKAHEALAESFFKVGVERMAEVEYRLAIKYAPVTVVRTRLEYADQLRKRGFCYPAIQLYKNALVVQPNHMDARAGLIACQLHLGSYREALFNSRVAISYDWERRAFQLAFEAARNALRDNPPAGTVRLDIPSRFTIAPFLVVGGPPLPAK